MGVEMLDELRRCLSGISYVKSFQRGQVGIFEGGDELVLQEGVENPALVVLASLLLVFSEEALLLPGWRP